MQAVVGVHRVEQVVVGVFQHAEKIDKRSAQSRTDSLQFLVDLFHLRSAAGVRGKGFEGIVHRQDALNIHLCLGRLGADGRDNLADIGIHGIGRDVARQVVDTDQQKDFGRLYPGHLAQAKKHPLAGIPADAPVFGARVLQQFAPFAAIGDAVPQKDNFVFRIREYLEQRFALVVIGPEFGWLGYGNKGNK